VSVLHGRELYPAVGLDPVSPAELGVAVEVPSSAGDDLAVVETRRHVPKSQWEWSQLYLADLFVIRSVSLVLFSLFIQVKRTI
jgi:hypothetical protein